MKLLLDTCTFLWAALDAPELSAAARDVLKRPESELYLSVVSGWEIALKSAAGRLRLPEPPHLYVPSRREAYGIEALALGEESALRVARLAPLHNDPFDRMLVCQAIVHGMAIVTPDEQIAQYAVRVVW